MDLHEWNSFSCPRHDITKACMEPRCILPWSKCLLKHSDNLRSLQIYNKWLTLNSASQRCFLCQKSLGNPSGRPPQPHSLGQRIAMVLSPPHMQIYPSPTHLSGAHRASCDSRTHWGSLLKVPWCFKLCFRKTGSTISDAIESLREVFMGS